MSCTTIPDTLRDLLAAVATHPGIPADHLDAEQYQAAVAYGWVYEHRGRVGLTGAGIWMPQVGDAERDGWPDGYTAWGLTATRGFFEVTVT